MIAQPSGTPITQKKTSYAWNYEYNPSGTNSVRPHAPIHIGERTYSHDANGNQLGWDNDNNGTRRNIVWDEENRIQSVFDNGHEKFYKYDDSGERVIKRGPQGETVYVNQYFTLRNREVGTKHVFVGQNRAVSKLMKQDKPGANPQGKTPIEKDLYYFHPDHLGSSNLITDTQGQLFEHLEYFPFGETWVEESSNTQRTPYLFTAKELDEETGLYYFGARYYDPRTSVWQSADPILEKYLGGSPAGGVYNPFNLNLYQYGLHNPVRYKDPDGNSPASVVLKQIAKRGVKEGIRDQADNLISQRLGKYMSKSMQKEFFKDVDKVVSHLDDSWWEIGLELVPVAGDIYGGVKGAGKLKKTYDAFQDLENKYVEKIASSLKGSDRERFIKNMRRLGVTDSKKDYEAMGTPYKRGEIGHHKREVSRNPGHSTDPRYIENQPDVKSHLDAHGGAFDRAPMDQRMNPAYE